MRKITLQILNIINRFIIYIISQVLFLINVNYTGWNKWSGTIIGIITDIQLVLIA